jgi:hypothetical protein
MVYFIRRKDDDCAVIALHPMIGRRPAPRKRGVIASGLPIGDVEGLRFVAKVRRV